MVPGTFGPVVVPGGIRYDQNLGAVVQNIPGTCAMLVSDGTNEFIAPASLGSSKGYAVVNVPTGYIINTPKRTHVAPLPIYSDNDDDDVVPYFVSANTGNTYSGHLTRPQKSSEIANPNDLTMIAANTAATTGKTIFHKKVVTTERAYRPDGIMYEQTTEENNVADNNQYYGGYRNEKRTGNTNIVGTTSSGIGTVTKISNTVVDYTNSGPEFFRGYKVAYYPDRVVYKGKTFHTKSSQYEVKQEGDWHHPKLVLYRNGYPPEIIFT